MMWLGGLGSGIGATRSVRHGGGGGGGFFPRAFVTEGDGNGHNRQQCGRWTEHRQQQPLPPSTGSEGDPFAGPFSV